MKVILIEDEKLNATHLKTLLVKYDRTIEVVAQYDSVKSSVAAFKLGVTADLLFVDIHLADGNSFDIFKEVKVEIPIIFTTAFDEYAIQAFKLNSVDYLLKPIGFEDLKVAMQKFSRQTKVESIQLIDNINKAFTSIHKQYKTRFMVKMGETIVSVKSEEIHFFISEDGVSMLTCNNGKRYALDQTMDQLESVLQPTHFFRINRKVILNINAIEKISNYFNSRLIVTVAKLDKEDAIVSRERVGEFKQWLDQ